MEWKIKKVLIQTIINTIQQTIIITIKVHFKVRHLFKIKLDSLDKKAYKINISKEIYINKTMILF
jgi:hypothetical protein